MEIPVSNGTFINLSEEDIKAVLSRVVDNSSISGPDKIWIESILVWFLIQSE